MFEPDDFKGRPYGFTTNQISHATLVGFLLIVHGSCLLWYAATGELPYKVVVAVFGAVSYATYEVVWQGWRGWDTVEDWWFVVVYGVFMPLLAFDEVTPGKPEVTLDLIASAPLLIVFYCHLALGALYRWVQQRNGDF